MLRFNCVTRVTSSMAGCYTSVKVATDLILEDVLISWSVEPPSGKEQLGGSFSHLYHVSCWWYTALKR